MRSELLVAHEKHGEFPLLTVYVVPVQGEKYIFNNKNNKSIPVTGSGRL
jgi:hypothetical protein